MNVQILLDGGSSDSFIHPRIAHHLQLPIEPGTNVKVMIGDGHAMRGEGIIKALPIVIQGHTITVSAFVLPIAGSDVVIGASWLATLGPHVADYTIGHARLKFVLDGKFVTLQGDTISAVYRVELHQFQRLLQTDAISQLYFMKYDIQTEGSISELVFPVDIPKELRAILLKVTPIFERPRCYLERGPMFIRLC